MLYRISSCDEKLRFCRKKQNIPGLLFLYLSSHSLYQYTSKQFSWNGRGKYERIIDQGDLLIKFTD